MAIKCREDVSFCKNQSARVLAFCREQRFQTRANELMTENFTVYVVDDDPGVLKAMCRLLRARGYQANPYASPRLFLEEHDATVPGCALLDVSMPDLDGLELQRALTITSGFHRPIVFVTGTGDVPTTVRAMKAGAIDFLTKPVKDEHLFDAISRAQEKDAQSRKAHSELESIRGKVASLTPREREVFARVVAGRMNKQIAGDLGIAEKTIKIHRSRVMEKLGTRTLADLVRMAEKM
jgi:FixJ family two-component response regulator